MADNHKIKNIYYMLAYAYSALREEGFDNVAAEDFDNVHDLLAAILVSGVKMQVKRGLHHEYIAESEALSSPRGKINIAATLKGQTMRNLKAACDYDSFSKDNLINQIIKSAMFMLLKHGEVKKENKEKLKSLLIYFDGIKLIESPSKINWGQVAHNRYTADYRLILNVCHIAIKGLLLTEEQGMFKLGKFINDELMSRLYERFVLNYYRKHFEGTADAAFVDWAVEADSDTEHLPQLKTDVTLTHKDKCLIIDCKYYSQTLIKSQFGDKRIFHTHNLNQIQVYVLNKAGTTGMMVGGALLYAKTNEDVTPNSATTILKHKFYIKTLDLNVEFKEIAKQLDELQKAFFNIDTIS